MTDQKIIPGVLMKYSRVLQQNRVDVSDKRWSRAVELNKGGGDRMEKETIGLGE